MAQNSTPESERPFRDDRWLEARLRHLWDTYYRDVAPGYPIQVRFGRRARYRFGSIFSRHQTCFIRVNALFAHPDVPEHVVDATLAHELAHYVHGYDSGLRKLHMNPHRGGVVDAEMKKRGCFFLEEEASVWRKTVWPTFYREQSGESLLRRAAREARARDRWAVYLNTPGFRTETGLQARLAELAPRFGFAAPPFDVGWLRASLRHVGLSYLYSRETTVRLHGVLADPHVPDAVIDYELSYWLAACIVGNRWAGIERALQAANLWTPAQKAIRWRRKVWPRYRTAHHPLRAQE